MKELDCEHTNAVSNECWSVFTEYALLTKNGFTVAHKEVNNSLLCLRARYYFKELKVSWRVEKVSFTEMLLEIFASSFAKLINRYTTCVRSDESSRLSMLSTFQTLLYIESFYDYLNDPIAISNTLKIVVEVSRPQFARTSWNK